MALDYPTLPGDIDHLIADDHAVVERLFQHLEDGRGNRRVLADQISFELALHAYAEETVLYPIWPEIGMTDERDDAEHEHHEMKRQMVVLGRTEPGEPEFEQSLATLIRVTRHHVHDEEDEELPEFRQKAGSERMAELGRQFLAAKRQAPTRPHPHAPDEGLAERIAGVLARPLDLVRDVLSGKKKELGTDASGLLTPQAQAIVDAWSAMGPMPPEILEPDQARRQPTLSDAVRKVMADRGIEGPEPVDSVEDRTIPDAAGGRMRLRVYRPPAAGPGPLPIVVWVHGGGWVLHDVDTYDASCRGVCTRTRAIVVSPDYRRAPEAPFPAAHDDVLAAYRWTFRHADELGGDPGRMGIGGESTGGTMAAATVLSLAEAGERRPAAVVSVYPLTTGEQFGPSMEDAADARPLTRPLLSWAEMHAFRGEPDAAKDPRIDLHGWSARELTFMPPTLVITAERDVLRSQGQEFARHLDIAAIPTTYRYYLGVMHEFFGAAAVLDAADQAQRETAAHFTHAFTAAGV
ncbi:alpha/beta hydrolase fold domain-containing protein [Geodermatophilus ruber]|uniref:Acetyl esterase/lipase n=1 Tax=Geodermatophilus ruber TaxID=504800 RepID=A0A1I4A7P9_9ACTN|nr:alpha/beta hydrolase fold domain-containing protein [Geodermatophilus ruber]SFK52442.1 Acetyl esterase/lipase [Geodermatophilus ruber]